MYKIIEMSKIKNGKNIRTERDSEILELAQSIEVNGLINPIMVKPIGGGMYEVVAGHRRFEAVKRLGLPHIECTITEETGEKGFNACADCRKRTAKEHERTGACSLL